MNSRHLTGHAVDIIAIGEDGIATYDMDDMSRVASVVREVAKEQGVPIQWGAAAKYGGDFKTFNDSPHFQLPWKQYPAIGVSTTTRVVEAAKAPPAAATTGAVVGGGAAISVPSLPDLPSPPDTRKLNEWTGFGETLSYFTGWVTDHPVLTVACAAWCGVVWFWPTIWERFQWARSSLSS
jgi:hypothetical protein